MGKTMKISLLDVAVLGIVALAGAGQEARAEAPTYHREVVRILQKNCQDCHRPGQVAPFSLLDLRAGAEARRRHRARDRGAEDAPLAGVDERGGAVPRRAGAVGRGDRDA